MLIEDLTWGNKYVTQYTDEVLQNCTLETYNILLTNLIPINLTKKFKKEIVVQFLQWNTTQQQSELKH